MRTRTLETLCVAIAATAASAAGAAPIYLKGGQCIQIGSQEVCAMSSDTTTPAKDAFHVQHLCRYGNHPGAEIPNLKNHALIQILTAANGTKTETIIRQFGINDSDKVECQKEADKLNGAKP